MGRDRKILPRTIKPDQPIYLLRFVGNPEKALAKAPTAFRLYPGPETSYYVTERSLNILKECRAPFEIARRIEPGRLGVALALPIESVFYGVPPDDIVAEIIALALSRKNKGKPHHPLFVGRTAEKLPGSFVLDYPGGSRRYRWRWMNKPKGLSLPTFAQRFPKLTRMIADPDTKFVVSLGSGGLRMFAHASLFRLIEALGVRKNIDEIWGCSGGAIAGMAYALGADPMVMEQEGYDLYQRKYDFRVNPTRGEVFKNFFIDMIMPGGSANLEGFVDVRRAMEKSLKRVAVRKRPFVPFFAVAYNMNTRKNEILTPSRIRTSMYDGAIKHCSAINSVLASSAIPVLHVPRIVKRGRGSYTYIDGSLYEEVPLSSVYQKWRVDRNKRITKKKRLFVLASNLFYFISTASVFRKFPFNRMQGLKLLAEMMKLTDRARAARIKDQMDVINGDPHAHVVSLHLPTLSRYNCLDPRIIPVAIDRAHASFFKQLLRIEHDLPEKW
jgi:predicted acylesterase/phospholipase RssA